MVCLQWAKDDRFDYCEIYQNGLAGGLRGVKFQDYGAERYRGNQPASHQGRMGQATFDGGVYLLSIIFLRDAYKRYEYRGHETPGA